MRLEEIRRLQKHGFKIFPLDGKLPLIPDFEHGASTKEEKIKTFWVCPVTGMQQPWNVGISTTGLLAVDIDDKDGKQGSESIRILEDQGRIFPKTYTQTTPSGRHLVYSVKTPVSNSASFLGNGIDIRGKGGYIVGAGSEIGDKTYTADFEPVVEAPEWLVKLCTPKKKEKREEVFSEINEQAAARRATHYLKKDAPIAVEGEGGNHCTFTVAAYLKDIGISSLHATELMLEHWNDRCDPPWDREQLERIVHNAYSYGKNAPGIAAPESDFIEPLPPGTDESFIDALNKDYAFIITGSTHRILYEAKDEVKVLQELTFHRALVSKTIDSADGKKMYQSKLWMNSPKRRSYDGFCFDPSMKNSPSLYNLFRGFPVKPAVDTEQYPESAHEALKSFIDHTFENICGGDAELFDWTMGYFAHMFQKPEEKPHVAIVLQGEKGVGKNVFVERIASLLGRYHMLTSNGRYLTSNFTGHFENLLMFTLDEAFWSGDKAAEGNLKNLITGDTHVIEKKGQESYLVANCMRVVILGNESWLVPATHDERRFAVLKVGNKRRRDTAYFNKMCRGMKAGGDRLLLRYLLSYDISHLNFNEAPATEGLTEQKVNTLSSFEAWWNDCLSEGHVIGSQFSEDVWPEVIKKSDFREAYDRYCRSRNINGRRLSAAATGKLFKKMHPSLDLESRIREEGGSLRAYKLGKLDDLRKEWKDYLENAPPKY